MEGCYQLDLWCEQQKKYVRQEDLINFQMILEDCMVGVKEGVVFEKVSIIKIC